MPSLWFRPLIAQRLTGEGIASPGELVATCNHRGGNWWRSVPRIGVAACAPDRRMAAVGDADWPGERSWISCQVRPAGYHLELFLSLSNPLLQLRRNVVGLAQHGYGMLGLPDANQGIAAFADTGNRSRDFPAPDAVDLSFGQLDTFQK
nr:phage integrase family protein [Paraburkholderia sp. BL27I4N3]